MQINSFKDLIVWQKAMELVEELYRIVKLLPKSESFILASQMLRAAISIPSNIAEGFKRNHKTEYRHFLAIANGSAGELETQILIAKKEYKEINFQKAETLVIEIQKILHTIIIKLS